MTDTTPCPACDKGTLRILKENNLVMYKWVYRRIPSHYSNCNICGFETATPEQTSINKQLMVDFSNEVDEDIKMNKRCIMIKMSDLFETGGGGILKSAICRTMKKAIVGDNLFPLRDLIINSTLNTSLQCLNLLPQYELLWRRYFAWCMNQHGLIIGTGTRFKLGHIVQHYKGFITDDKLKSIINIVYAGDEGTWDWWIHEFISGQCTIHDSINEIVNLYVATVIANSSQLKSSDRTLMASSVKELYKAKLIQIVTFGEWID